MSVKPASKAASEAELKKYLAERSTQQGVVRNLLTRIGNILKEDDATKVNTCESLCVSVLEHLSKHDAFLDDARSVAEDLNYELSKETDEKVEKLTQEVTVLYEEATKWVLQKKKENPGMLHSAVGSEIGAGVPEKSGNGRVSPSSPEEGSHEVRALRKELELMQARMLELDDARHEIGQLRDVIVRQEDDSEKKQEVLDGIVSDLKGDLSKVQQTLLNTERDLADERYAVSQLKSQVTASTPLKPRVSSIGQGDVSPSSMSPEDMLTMSQIFASSNADVFRKVLDQSSAHHKNYMTSIHAPKIEIKTFTGDKTEYHAFLRRFDNLVGSTDATDGVKLNTLVQYCSAGVQKHLDCCTYKTPQAGYMLAREILKTRYGNPFLVSQAWVEKMNEYPNLQKPDEILQFASELSSCRESLSTLGYLSDMENSVNMRTIVSKIPNFIQNRWRKRNREIVRKGNRPTLMDLVEVITEAAEELSDPIFGAASMNKMTSSSDKVQPKKGYQKRVVAVAVEDSPGAAKSEYTRKLKCVFCSEAHYPRTCPKFKKLDPAARLKMVKEYRLCILCLNPSHVVKTCNMRWTCQVAGCNRRHNTELHKSFQSENDGDSKSDATSDGVNEEVGLFVEAKADPVLHNVKTDSYSVPVVPVMIDGKHGPIETNVLLDTGASMTFVTKELVRRLGVLPYGRERITMSSMTDTVSMMTDLINLSIKAVYGSNWKAAYGVAIVERLPVSGAYVKRFENLERWPYLEEIDMPKPTTTKLDMLIGQSNAKLFKEQRRVEGPSDGQPYAVETAIGWVLMGHYIKYKRAPPVPKPGSAFPWQPRPVVPCVTGADDEITSTLDRMWQVDSVPDREHEDPVNVEIKRRWKEETKLIDGHLEIPIPLKNEPPNPPNNYKPVKKRFDTLTRKLQADPQLCEKFVAAMKADFAEGYAERCTDPPREGYLWYHPKQVVITDRKPGKCRIVGDLSIIFMGFCLNKEVHQGPNFTADLTGILIAFRMYSIAITGDIRQMYNQVRVPESQRDLLRFLWWKDDVVGGEIEECRMTTQTFGGTWCPSASMYAYQWLVDNYGQEYCEEAIDALLRRFYVDDLLKSIWETDLGIKMVLQLHELLSRVGFFLTKIGSNDRKILESLPKDVKAVEFQELELGAGEETATHTLGSVWRPIKDVLSFRVIKTDKPLTRRGVLSTTSSLYDPLGLVAPFVLRAKMILQRLCKEKLEWDEPIPAIYNDSWRAWMADVDVIQEYAVPRWLGLKRDLNETYQLNVFTDASLQGYGAVVYLVVKNQEQMVTSSLLVQAKAKVTPMNTMTVPRLELSAAILGVKLERSVRAGLQIELEETRFWTDSMIVLWYIRGHSWKFKTFVANRVVYLQEHTETCQWNHVPTDINPADAASRGLSARELLDYTEWITGPSFLTDEKLMPEQPDMTVIGDGLELKKQHVFVMMSVDCVKTDVRKKILEYYSRWSSLLKGVMIFRRYFKYLKKKVADTGIYTVEERQSAEKIAFKLIQDEYLTKDQRKNRIFNKLFPFDGDGLCRVGGRLGLSDMDYEAKHPPILPDSPATRALIREMHEKNGHGGVMHTYYDTKMKVWILGGRRVTKAALKDCVFCKRVRAKPMSQLMAPLPEERVKQGTTPFQYVGIDYCGPFYVKVGRAMVKRYVCVITCMQSRASHLEISFDLSTSSFLQALQRFIARRGKPKVIMSDNGTNFVGARRELRRLLDDVNDKYVGSRLADEGIVWKNNTPLASHHGGVWERLIRIYRTLMMAVAGKQTMTDESLPTFTAAVEQIMNSRPLTTVTDDPEEVEVVTPNHLLTMKPAEQMAKGSSRADAVRHRWKQVQYQADLFWKRWTRTYLQTLQVRQKWTEPKDDLKKDEMVLMLDEAAPRLEWPLARVIEVYPGRDGRVRSALLKTGTGTYKRPITKIIRLEEDQ